MSELIPYNRGALPPMRVEREPVQGGYAPPAEEFDLRLAFAILRRRAVLVVAVTGVALAAAAYLVYRDVPQYRANAVIRLIDQRRAMTSGIEVANQDLLKPSEDPLLSQIEVLRTRTVAGRVVDRLGLRLRPDHAAVAPVAIEDVQVTAAAPADTFSLRFRANGYSVMSGDRTAQAAYGQPIRLAGVSFTVPVRPPLEQTTLVLRPAEEMVDSLLRRLRARAREKTDVVDVEFSSPDPALAQQVVNTVVEEFQALNARQAQEQSRRRRAFLAEQLAEMDSLHTAAQLELSEFRRREQVFSSREKFVSEQAGLSGLEVRREELVAERRMFESLLAGLVSERPDAPGLLVFASSPGIAENPVTSTLFTQLLGFEAAHDSLTLGDHARAATDPDVQRLAGLIAVTRGKLADALRGHVDALDARIAALVGLRERSTAAMQELPDAEAEEVRYVQNVETIRRMADQLRVEYQKARISEAVEGGQVEVLDYASLPLKPIPARSTFKLALGLLVGLLVASGAAFAAEQMNTSIRAPDELEGTLGVPGLAVIPRMMPTTGNGKLRLPGFGAQTHGHVLPPTVADSHSTGAEAYRKLRTSLIFAQTLQHMRRLLITSASSGDGKSTVSANLGVTFANQGLRVLLIDADLRRPTLHRAFATPQAPGLTQVVLGQENLADTIRQTRVENLFLLTAGTLPPNPAELLGQDQVRALLAQLAGEFDLVIVDSSPVAVAADAAILSTMVDGALLVVRAGETDRAAAQHAVQLITSVGGNIVGAVLNDPDAKLPQYGQKYSYHYKAYGATDV
ncbi:MAG TPA: polysaccharide biosynthesis tyrosine autokinase [Longimicrobiales bacterium]